MNKYSLGIIGITLLTAFCINTGTDSNLAVFLIIGFTLAVITSKK